MKRPLLFFTLAFLALWLIGYVSKGVPPPMFWGPKPAASVEYDWISSYTPGAARDDYTGLVGAKITINTTNITVTQLGIYIIAGGVQSHYLRWTSADCTTTNANALVNWSGKSGWHWVAVTPFTATASTAYCLASTVVVSSDQWSEQADIVQVGAVTSAANAHFGGDTNSCPDTASTANRMFVGVSFRYTVP